MAVRPGSTTTENSRGTENLVHSAMPSPHSPSKPSLPEAMSPGHRHHFQMSQKGCGDTLQSRPAITTLQPQMSHPDTSVPVVGQQAIAQHEPAALVAL